MGQEHSTALKRAFEKLDTDHNGQLNLGDILTIQDVGGVEHLVHNGPLLLFRFDKTGDGAINYSEFSKLLSYVKSKEKELRAKGMGALRRKVWCPIDRETMNLSYELSRDASTPAITGQRPDDEPATEEDLEEVEGDVLAEEISRDAGDYFDHTVATADGRRKFLNWLFKMTDTDNDERLTADELIVMIRALRHDGISPEDLTYDPERLLRDAARAGTKSLEDQDRIFADQLLREYDVEHRGYLTPAEFSVLASLIVKNYELRNEYQDQNPENQHRLKGFSLKRRLGKGANGEVRLAVELKTGIRKAVKIVPKRDMAHLSSLDTEITAMMILKHEHIVKLDQVQEDDTNVYFVMELCGGGNISDYLDGKPISETLARFYFLQIVEGVAYCHRTGVAHRDLKLDNILLDNTANIKITDFGHAGIYKSGWDVFQTPLVGGLCHLAPEQILGMPYSGEKHDVWSLGVILFVLLSGHSPFMSNHPQQLLDDIKNVKYTMPSGLSKEAKHLIAAMLVADSTKRPSIAQIAESPWLTKGDVDAPLLNSFTLPVPAGFWKRWSCNTESMCRVLQLLGIEPVYNVSIIQSIADEHMDIRCHWPAKDVRFSFKVKEVRPDGTEILEFRLSSGASREFLSLMTKLKVSIAARIRRNKKLDSDVSRNPLLKASGATSASGSNRSSPNLHTTGQDRISDDLPIEDETSLRPQIITLQQLQALEAAELRARAEAEDAYSQSMLAVDESDGSRKKKNGHHLKEASHIPREKVLKESASLRDSGHHGHQHHASTAGVATVKESSHKHRHSSAQNPHHHPHSPFSAPIPHREVHSQYGSKEHSPDSSESDSDSLAISAPVPRHSHRSGSKHNMTLASASSGGANGVHPSGSIHHHLPPTTSSSHHHHGSTASSGILADDSSVRRSRSVPFSSLQAPGIPEESSSHHHKDKQHGHHSNGHSTPAGVPHGKKSSHRHDDEDGDLDHSTSSKHLKTSDPKELKEGSHSHTHDKHSSHRSTKDKEGHRSSRVGDESESISHSTASAAKHSKSRKVPPLDYTIPPYIPGQIMTQIPGLVAYCQVASEPFPRKKTRKSLRDRSRERTSASSISRSNSRKLSHNKPSRRSLAKETMHHHESLLTSSSETESWDDHSESQSSISSTDTESSDVSSRSRTSRTSRASERSKSRRDRSPSASVSRSRNPSPVRGSMSITTNKSSHSRQTSPTRGRKASPARSKSPREKSKSRNKSPSRSRSRSRQPSPVRASTSSTISTSRAHSPTRSVTESSISASKASKSHKEKDSHHSKDPATPAVPHHSTKDREKEKERHPTPKVDRLASIRDSSHTPPPFHSYGREDDVSHLHVVGSSTEGRSKVPPPGPTTTPAKTSKSFKRSKDAQGVSSTSATSKSSKTTHSLPVSPKQAKSPAVTTSSSGSESESESASEAEDDLRSSAHAGLLMIPRQLQGLAGSSTIIESPVEDSESSSSSSSVSSPSSSSSRSSHSSSSSSKSINSHGGETSSTLTLPSTSDSPRRSLLCESVTSCHDSDCEDHTRPRADTASSAVSLSASTASTALASSTATMKSERSEHRHREHLHHDKESSKHHHHSHHGDKLERSEKEHKEHKEHKDHHSEHHHSTHSHKEKEKEKEKSHGTLKASYAAVAASAISPREKGDKTEKSQSTTSSHAEGSTSSTATTTTSATHSASVAVSTKTRKHDSVRSAHHSPAHSSDESLTDSESSPSATSPKPKKHRHQKHASLTHLDIKSENPGPVSSSSASSVPGTTKKSSHTKKASKTKLDVTQELSESESDSDEGHHEKRHHSHHHTRDSHLQAPPAHPQHSRSAAEITVLPPHVSDRTQSLSSLSSHPPHHPTSRDRLNAAAAAAAAEAAALAAGTPTKRSKSFKKERTKERSKAHDAKHAAYRDFDDSS